MTMLLTPLDAPRPEVVDDVRRRDFLGILAAAGLLAGCGGGAGPSSESAAETRTVVGDDERSVEVPVQPRRVVFLDEEGAAHATTLGYVPHAVAWAYGPEYVDLLTGLGGLTGDLSGVRDAGKNDDLDFETLISLEPDLLIGFPREDDVRDRLSSIAPYLAFDARVDRGGKPFAQARLLADVLGLSDVLEQRIDDYEQALADFRTEHGPELEGLDYTFLDTGDDGTLYTYSVPGYAFNTVMKDLEIPMSEAMRAATAQALGYPEDPDSGYATFSVEVAADYDAGLLFLGRYDTQPINPGLLRVLGTTFASREDQVFPVDSNQWTFHLLESNFALLEELDGYFGDQEIVART